MRPCNGRNAEIVRLGLATLSIVASLVACAAPDRGAGVDPLCDELSKLAGPARGEVAALARLLAIRPSMAIDFSAASGEYCLDTGGHVMAHFSSRPAETSEDLVYFVDAAPLVAKGLRLDEFPGLEPGLGRMQPNTWYRYEGKGVEPHHGDVMQDRTWLMLAVDVK